MGKAVMFSEKEKELKVGARLRDVECFYRIHTMLPMSILWQAAVSCHQISRSSFAVFLFLFLFTSIYFISLEMGGPKPVLFLLFSIALHDCNGMDFVHAATVKSAASKEKGKYSKETIYQNQVKVIESSSLDPKHGMRCRSFIFWVFVLSPINLLDPFA